MKLTEKQCALLSGFMYLDQSVKKSDDNGNKNIIGKIIEYLKDETTGQFDREQLDPSGGITKEEAVELLKEIERDPVLRNLKAVHSVNTGIRATCFVDSKAGDTKDAIVAFRGTGGITRAWEDNIVGAYEPVTAMQQEAVDFVRDTCSDYMISQVTGHSKGGNLAMHATIASEQNITDCVVFDAQGFNSLYFNENRNLIEQTAKYIKSINADKDFVSPLLNPAALPENTVYIKIGDVKSFGENHKLTMLLKNELFDSEGKYRQEVYGERVFGSNQISKATRALDSSGFLRTGFGKTLTDLIAVEVGARMTNEPEQSKAIRFEEKAKEYRAIRSGIFHVDKHRTDGATDLPAPDDPKPYLLNHDKVVISIDSFESLKKDALEASELSKSIMTAQRKISEAEIKAKGIVTRANNKASGVEEEITRPQLLQFQEDFPHLFTNGVYQGKEIPDNKITPESQNKQDIEKSGNGTAGNKDELTLSDELNSSLSKMAESYRPAEQIKDIEVKKDFWHKDKVIISGEDFKALKREAEVGAVLSKHKSEIQKYVESAGAKAESIVAIASGKAARIIEMTATSQLLKVKKDFPQLFKDDNYKGKDYVERKRNNTLNKGLDFEKV